MALVQPQELAIQDIWTCINPASIKQIFQNKWVGERVGKWQNRNTIPIAKYKMLYQVKENAENGEVTYGKETVLI